MSKQARANILLVICAAIWGCAFVAQRMVVGVLQPFTFNALRSWVGAAVLLPAALLYGKLEKKRRPDAPCRSRKTLLLGGLCCGALLFLATNLQQFGIEDTGSGKSAFVTAMYIVLVPVLGLMLRKKVRLFTWLGIVVCVGGLYLLCVKGDFSIVPADVFLLLCALAFSFQIMSVDHFAPLTNCVALSCIQFTVAAVLGTAAMLLLEQPTWANIVQAAAPILYAGVLSSGVAYTLQILGQRDSDPTVASLLMCLESVFAVLAGYLYGESLTVQELIGCGVMLLGIVLSQLPAPRTREEREMSAAQKAA